ncbi:hypothetical protein PR048_025488 [Dryococelus australis]|uniref:HTH psq-type domain-containing protein n=1 Tax=Dryococelus australis TaxID=614101 RepID=A0ABQ9GRE8_9NEOP|nr:hypothetical protein PR048_025488 [Dryococelus australis]
MAPTLSKSPRKQWESASMLKAVEAVRNKEMGFLKASKTFCVPRSTLENHVNHKTIQDAEVLCSTMLDRKCVLPDELESKLAEYCMVMEKRFYGLRTNDIRRLAFQLAARNNVKHPFSEDKGAADTIDVCHPFGWIQQELFTQVDHIKPKPDDPVILVLDRHYSHTRNINVVKIGSEHGVHIVCLPPHSIHKFHQLNVSLMSPLKTYYAKETETWLKNHPFRLLLLISPTQANPSTASTSKEFLSSADFSPPPLMKKPATSTARATRSGKAALITSSPYKRQLEESMRRYPTPKKPKCDKALPKRQRQIRHFGGEGSSHEDKDDDAECIYCHDFFPQNKKGEVWVRCTKCFKWYHDQCAQVTDWKSFICENCADGQLRISMDLNMWILISDIIR